MKPGSLIAGKYRIVATLGRGGMGTVFDAEHTGTGARVALKLIHSQDVDPEIVTRFEREARATASVVSQHIVRVFDTGIDEKLGCPYLVMEKLEGEDLSHLLKRARAPLPTGIALRVVAQACLGLSRAHAVGIIHRDIKPANLFLAETDAGTGEFVVKVLDFGIAKVKMDYFQDTGETGGFTATGRMLGSPHYMSPEQAQGLRTVDHRADLWSLGVVLYKCLAGRTPYAELDGFGQVLIAICSQPVKPIEEVAPWVPPHVAAIVHKALAFHVEERFQTAEEMFAAITPWLQETTAPPSQISSLRLHQSELTPSLSVNAQANPMAHGNSGSLSRSLVGSVVTSAEAAAALHPGLDPYAVPMPPMPPSMTPSSQMHMGVAIPGPMPMNVPMMPGEPTPHPMGVAPAAASGPVPMMMMPPPGMPMIGVQTGSTLTSAGNATRAVGHDAPRRSSNVALVMATAALVVAGWLVFKQRDHGAAVAAVPPKPAPAAVATAAADPGSPGSAAITAASGPPAALAPAPAVSASAAAATSATPAPRTVKLLVAPADAIVEVDGVPAKVTGGAVDVTGALGSTHTVHLSKGKRDHQEDVAITARGALPDRVSIASPSGGARGGRPVFVIKAPTFGGGGDGRAGSGSGGGGRGPGGSDDGTGGEPAIDLMPPANGDWTRPLDSPSQ